ncbi:MAG: biliverdin-producing heme oxygenase [Thermodesulfovibrionales bacterium]|nr:biliverdin-producing heme oxygenase [Thermodesulfovibrionales bacterium]
MSEKLLMTILKETTKKDHDRLETLVFFKEIMKGTLPLESYIRYLRLLAVLHGTLEKELINSNDEIIRKIWHPKRARFELLTKDIDYYSDYLIKDVVQAVDLTQQFASLIRNQSKKGALHLLGYFYVFEGSTRGSVKLRELIRKNFNMSEDSSSGLSYFVNYGDRVQDNWNDFVDKMNNLPLNQGDIEKICLAAIDCFQRLFDIINCLDSSSDREQRYTVIGLNPLGGNHPIPQDEQELKASIIAGKKCIEEFPYIIMRYGSSGKYFTSSDSAWLTYLTELNQDAFNGQVKWLLNVLSTRGMPSILLERHLDYLYKELINTYPERENLYIKLNHTQEMLKTQRLKFINEERLKKAEEDFFQKINDEERKRLPDAIKILSSSICDESIGIAGSLKSVVDWLCDENRFSIQWIKAINDTLDVLTQLVKDYPKN